jgi:hypothetical protein
MSPVSSLYVAFQCRATVLFSLRSCILESGMCTGRLLEISICIMLMLWLIVAALNLQVCSVTSKINKQISRHSRHWNAP